MSIAFWGNARDHKWLRDIRNRTATVKPKMRPTPLPTRRSMPKMLADDRIIYKRAAMRAAQIVCRAIKAGKLVHPTKLMCVDCKVKPARVYEHRDYAEPLTVEPVCNGCNLLRGPAALSKAVPSNGNKRRTRLPMNWGHMRNLNRDTDLRAKDRTLFTGGRDGAGYVSQGREILFGNERR
jgi:hypothetical protein